MLRCLPGADGVGFELDDLVHQLTRRNLAALQIQLRYEHGDYVSALSGLDVPENALLVVFVAPPWGSALSSTEGLDLRGATPPVRDIVHKITRRFSNRTLCGVQIYEKLLADSLDELARDADWSTSRFPGLPNAGMNRHGLLLMIRGWRPAGSTVA